MSEKKEFKKTYEKKIQELQIELVKLQDWVIKLSENQVKNSGLNNASKEAMETNQGK